MKKSLLLLKDLLIIKKRLLNICLVCQKKNVYFDVLADIIDK